jgi:glutamate synthase domain-containing protein 3
VIIGNTVLYGATAGRAFFRGCAGERFAVRNSGANAVVEGVGDHGCEYMTGGRVVVLGPTGRNFAAGMSGGLAFVLDEDGAFRRRVNPTMLDQLEALDEGDAIEVRDLVQEHVERTGSPVGRRVLDEWDDLLDKFVKVFPTDYKRVLAELAEAEAENAGESAASHHDHPQSTGGEGFVTTEGEADEELVPSPDTGASGDAARDGRIAPDPSAEEVRQDG